MGRETLHRFFVLAADGAAPDLLRQFMADGTCPHLAQTAQAGLFAPLLSTLPPVSPVAWTTFLTGCQPARHGVVDFFARQVGQYRLTLGLYRVAGTTPPRYESRRRVPGLPELLRRGGLTGYFLWLPGTFPPEATRGGVLAGLGVPDALGSLGVSALYTSQPGAGRGAAAGDRRQVVPLEPVAEGRFRAPLVPPSSEPTLWLEQMGETLRLGVGEGPAATLRPGEWTEWLRFPLQREGQPASPAMARFRWLPEAPPMQVYRTAVQHPPDETPFPLSHPPEFASRVARWVGPYATLGLACDAGGLQIGLADEETFLQDAWRTWEQRSEALVRLAQTTHWHLAVGHLFTLDLLQHLFWGEGPAPGEAVRTGYAWLDRLAGRLLQALGPDVTFLMVSDHGMQPLRRRVGLNRWLHGRGYLALRQGAQGPAVDWAQTQAASLGHGGIFLNVRGREPMGVVEPGQPYRALRERLMEELRAWRDPATGELVMAGVWPREAVHQGPALEWFPDIAVALRPGYGLDRRDMMGQVAPGPSAIQARRGRWTAGHEGPYRPEDVPGVLLAAGPAVRCGTPVGEASLADLAPTLLAGLGLDVPGFMDGRPLREILRAGS